MMKIDVIPAAALSEQQFAAWSRIQRSDPTLSNPFFRPEFTKAVATERSDIEVAIWELAGEPVGFLPFERTRGNIGRPVGSHINIMQGAIARQDTEWSPRQTLKAAGLRAWRFDHLLGTQSVLTPFHRRVCSSPYLDLLQGFDHYRSSRGRSAAKFISHILQKDRKAGRELGDVRLRVNFDSLATLARLFRWKSGQCRLRQVSCVYELDSIVRLHRRLLDYATHDFAGVLFSLYLGDRLASALFCLRSGSVLQGSILGYDPELSPYAPGLVLLVRVAQAANSLGIDRIELGSGGEKYKDKLASGTLRVAEGIVNTQPLYEGMYRGLYWAKDRLRDTALRVPYRRVRRQMLATRIWLGLAE